MNATDDLDSAIADALGSFADLPEGIAPFRQALFRRHATALRFRRDVDPNDFPHPLEPVPWYPLGFRCTDSDVRLGRTLPFACGDFYLQDAGSMLALAACRAEACDGPRLICDLCAAPGGKASALLESIGDGFLLANEPIKSRVAPLAFNLARTGNDRYAVSSLDPERLAECLPGRFDLVLVDAPCSGQALMAKGKQSAASLSKKQMDHSASRARRILSAAARLLRQGGQLVFSTCTFAEVENESQVRWLLDDGADPSLSFSPNPIESLNHYSSDGSGCCYRVWPHRHPSAGAFAASLTSESESESAERVPTAIETEPFPSEVLDCLQRVPARRLHRGASIYGWPQDAPAWVEGVAAAGPEIAFQVGRTWKPSHEVALRRGEVRLTHETAAVDAGLAEKFLSGHPIPVNQPGWRVVTLQGRPLGWCKAKSGTGKNQVPKHLRRP